MDQAIAVAPAADVTPVKRWIPVEERLPEDNGHVLAYTEDDYAVIELDYDTEYGFGYWRPIFDAEAMCQVDSEWIGFDLGEVTHWMPLPEPPKGE